MTLDSSGWSPSSTELEVFPKRLVVDLWKEDKWSQVEDQENQSNRWVNDIRKTSKGVGVFQRPGKEKRRYSSEGGPA